MGYNIRAVYKKSRNEVTVMFGLFRRKGGAETSADKKTRDMKCRKVSFEDGDIEELSAEMRSSPNAALKLKPVNYYAVKNNYILALIYTSEDLGENYVRFKRIDHEKQTGESALFPLDKETVIKLLAKVGIIIDPDPPCGNDSD